MELEQETMQFVGLFRDTWWLWGLFLLAGLLLAIFVDLIFLVTFPICVFAFIYFAMMRYDEQGNVKKSDK